MVLSAYMKKLRPTLFCVLDIETTYWKRIAFDIAWKVIDRKGRVYAIGSYLVTDALSMDVPFFKEKLGFYFDDVSKGLIVPRRMIEIREIFNAQIAELIAQGYEIVFCAYNARFDADHLGKTCHALTGHKFLDHKLRLLDIWHFWCMSAPMRYNITTEKGNPRTSAEAVYSFEFSHVDFVERHIAFSDVEIEADILLKILARKKKIPFVNHPTEFRGSPWRLLLDRPRFAKQPKEFYIAIGTQFSFYEEWEPTAEQLHRAKKAAKPS